MNTLLIHMAPPQHMFNFFYSLAFILAISVLLMEGYRRKFPMIPWILIISFSQILFIIGTKLFALSHDEWSTMIGNFQLVSTTKKELFGGMLLLGLGLWIGKVWMKFKPPFLDAFAIAIPLALSVQKAGCFFAGCCFGKTCDLPWAVQYPVLTLPHYHQFQQGLIHQGDLFSLPVHPVQIYEMLGALMVVFLVIFFRKRWFRTGSSFLFSISLYLVVRFMVEFFKDPMAHTTGGGMIGVLNQTQWAIMAILPALLFILIYREKRQKFTVVPVPQMQPSFHSILTFLTASVLLIITLSDWFSFMEIFVILITFILSAALTIAYVFKNSRYARYKLVYVCLLLLPFLLMSQTLPNQMEDSVLIKKSKIVSFGISGADFDNTHEIYSGEGCDRIGNRSYFNEKYFVSGAGIAFKNENVTKKYETKFGLNLILGSHAETFLKVDTTLGAAKSVGILLPDNNRKTIFEINPYLKFDSRWFGIGGGMHIGKLSYAYYDKEESGYGFPATGRELVSFYPQVYARFGPRDIIFADYHLGDHFPSALPGYRQMFGLGSGFGREDGTSLRIGTIIGEQQLNNGIFEMFSTSLHGIYTTGYIPMKGGFILEPLMLFDYSAADSKTDLHFSVALHYEWGQKLVKRAAIPLE
jgi:prolipoprotein diacylglyceryltransferase